MIQLIIGVIHTTYLAAVRLKPGNEIQAWRGFEPMTSAILVQYSTNRAIEPREKEKKKRAGHIVSS